MSVRCPQFLRTRNCAYNSSRYVLSQPSRRISSGITRATIQMTAFEPLNMSTCTGTSDFVHCLPFSPEAYGIEVNETMRKSTTAATAATSAAANSIESKTVSVDWLNHSGLLRALCGLSAFVGINQLLGLPSNGASLAAVLYLYWAAYIGDHLADCRYGWSDGRYDG